MRNPRRRKVESPIVQREGGGGERERERVSSFDSPVHLKLRLPILIRLEQVEMNVHKVEPISVANKVAYTGWPLRKRPSLFQEAKR